MDTRRQKNSLGLKLILGVIGLVVILFVGFVAWIAYLDIRDFSSTTNLAADSEVIVFAHVDTNAPTNLIVTEIWKQSALSSARSIKVGAKFPLVWPKDGGALPDGAVLFFQQTLPLIESGRISLGGEYFVRQGRIDNLTIEEFKKTCRL